VGQFTLLDQNTRHGPITIEIIGYLSLHENCPIRDTWEMIVRTSMPWESRVFRRDNGGYGLEHWIPQFDANIRQKPYSLERIHFEESMTFDELCSIFQTVQRQFEDAATIEEKQRLLAISKQIIMAANAEIDEFRRGFASRMILVGTVMTASHIVRRMNWL
jgi:hypothetical protein